MKTLIALLLAALVTPAFAQEYPQREIRSICNFGPGSGADILVRFYSDKLAGWFNQITGEQDTREFLARTAFDPFPGSPEQMQALMRTDTARWKGYVELAKIQPQ